MAARHGKVVIQDALDFFTLASSEQGCISYLFIEVDDYEESEIFLAVLMTDIQAAKDTIKAHASKSTDSNKIKSEKPPATVRIVTVEQIYAMDGRKLISSGENLSYTV